MPDSDRCRPAAGTKVEHPEWRKNAIIYQVNTRQFTAEGTFAAAERHLGDGLETAIVLSVVGEGMPLIYNGQEAGNFKRLEFFERDPIEWKAHRNGEVYKKLFALKKTNTALWNAKWGARMINVPNSAPSEVLSFVRQNEQDKVFAALNFSPKSQLVTFQERLFHKRYADYFGDQSMELGDSAQLELAPWGYRILIQ